MHDAEHEIRICLGKLAKEVIDAMLAYPVWRLDDDWPGDTPGHRAWEPMARRIQDDAYLVTNIYREIWWRLKGVELPLLAPSHLLGETSSDGSWLPLTHFLPNATEREVSMHELYENAYGDGQSDDEDQEMVETFEAAPHGRLPRSINVNDLYRFDPLIPVRNEHGFRQGHVGVGCPRPNSLLHWLMDLSQCVDRFHEELL